MEQKAVLLIAFGGPTHPSEIRPFLDKVLEGRSVPQQRIETVIQQYESIGGKSPLNEITFQQASALEALLKAEGNSEKVYVGMRNWHPLLSETLQQIVRDGSKKVSVIILSPFVCEASWTRYQKSIEQIERKINQDLQIIYARQWYHHPLFFEAMVDRMREMKKSMRDSTCLFAAHSIPVSMNEDSKNLSEQKLTYSEQIEQTAEKIAQQLNIKNWSVVYQSRSGHPREKWLEPDISDKLSELAKVGVRSVVVVPLGFVCDHVEVLYDLDIKAKKTAEGLGMEYLRAKTVGTHPKFIRMLAELIGKI